MNVVFSKIRKYPFEMQIIRILTVTRSLTSTFISIQITHHTTFQMHKSNGEKNAKNYSNEAPAMLSGSLPISVIQKCNKDISLFLLFISLYASVVRYFGE